MAIAGVDAYARLLAENPNQFLTPAGLIAAGAAPSQAHCDAFMNKLFLNYTNMSILILSDSTMDQSALSPGQRRPSLWLAYYLATAAPAVTVNLIHWNINTGSVQSDGFHLGGYDALGTGNSQVIQTGTGTGNAGGPFVLNIYNVAATGTTPAYDILTARWNVIITPLASLFPDVVIINHGHNLGSGNAISQRYSIGQLTRAVKTRWPLSAILVTAQNPTSPSRVGYDPLDIVRQETASSICAEEQCGLVNVLGVFLLDPNWITDYLNQDGLHENDLGAYVWATYALQVHFRQPLSFKNPASPGNAPSLVWVPASQFQSLTGSPVYALTNSETWMWALPPQADSTIQADVVLPEAWTAYDTWLFWCVAGTSGYSTSTVAAFHFKRQQRAYSINVPMDVAPYPVPAAVDPGVVTKNPNNGTAYQTIQSQLASLSTSLIAPTGMQIFRNGTSGTDTLTADNVYVKGVLFIKAY